MNTRILFLIPFLFLSLPAYGQSTKDVIIVNPPESPANVQGVVTVNSVSNPVSVMVGNDASNPVPVVPTSSPRIPWQQSVGLTLPDNAGSVGAPVITVPPDLRLVIENVSVWGSLGVDQFVSVFELVTTVNGVVQTHQFLPVQMVGPIAPGAIRHAAYFQTRLYADDETPVSIILQRAGGTTGDFALVAELSGYFVSADSPSLAP